jgi:hypothetical protein
VNDDDWITQGLTVADGDNGPDAADRFHRQHLDRILATIGLPAPDAPHVNATYGWIRDALHGEDTELAGRVRATLDAPARAWIRAVAGHVGRLNTRLPDGWGKALRGPLAGLTTALERGDPAGSRFALSVVVLAAPSGWDHAAVRASAPLRALRDLYRAPVIVSQQEMEDRLHEAGDPTRSQSRRAALLAAAGDAVHGASGPIGVNTSLRSNRPTPRAAPALSDRPASGRTRHG